jgi:hypothetical protein
MRTFDFGKFPVPAQDESALNPHCAALQRVLGPFLNSMLNACKLHWPSIHPGDYEFYSSIGCVFETGSPLHH